METALHKIKILHLEDQPVDAEHVARLLRKAGMLVEIKLVYSRDKYEEALRLFAPDIIISDHNLPSFNSIEAIELLKKSGLHIPFILVTGTVSEEFAVEAMRTGADDYILKDRMQRLPIAVENMLEKFRLEKGRKMAEVSMWESEAKYRSFFENSMDGILMTDTNGQILSANPAACSMFQMTENEIREAGRFGLVDLFDPRINPVLEQRQLTGKAKGEITCMRRDRSKFPGEISSSMFTDAYGQERTSLIIRDITERKNAEKKIVETSEALEKALNDLKKIMNSSLDMICAVDEQGRFKQVSAACETILGYKPEELIGKLITDFIWADDQEKTKEAVTDVMNGYSMTNFENRYLHKNGSVVPLVWSAAWDPKDRMRYGVARDATEKKKAEKILASERKRLSDLFINAPVNMSILKGKNHVIELANPTYLQNSGKKNIVGKTIREAFPEVEGQGAFELLDSVFASGISFSTNESEVQIDKDGTGILTKIYLNRLYQPYRDAEGKVAGIFYFGVDVTEQVLSRKKIEETEQRYRQIVETAQEGIWVIDENEKTTFVNNKLCEMLEYTREEMIGKEIYDFMDEEGKLLSLTSIKNRKDGRSGRAHLKYISRTKQEIWTNISANPLFDENGRYKGSLAMITDVTSQRKIEEENKKLALIAGLTVNAVVVTDVLGRITWINDGFQRITGYSFDEVVGKKPGEFLQGPGTDSGTIEYMQECQEQGLGFRTELLNYSKSGKPYWLDIEVKPLHDELNRLTGFMAIQQDITSRKQSESETLHLINSLQTKNKDLQQFSYIVSHNLRAPIAKILGLTSIIGVEPTENLELSKLIAQEANNLDEVVKDINVIVSARKTDQEKVEKITFEDVFLEIRQVLHIEIKESGAAITTDFQAAPKITSIKSYVYSILYNFLSNAIKYRKREAPLQIHIQTSQDELFITLSVQDNGKGIDLIKNGDKVFGLYKRFHHQDEIHGKGVGLNLVKTHAESLGGRVAVESKLNEGSVFKVYLPKSHGTDTN